MSLQPNKTNPALGWEVEMYLRSKGVQTPLVDSALLVEDSLKIAGIRHHFESIMQILGLDLKDDSLIDTPNRVAKMFINEIFWGLKPENFPKCTIIENKMGYDEMVVENNITMMSACEHHFVTIDGKAHVAYIPRDRVLGLSKLNRIVEYFARRPQVQERIGEQVFHALCYILNTDNVAVVIEGTHYCVKARGVEDHGSYTITSKLGGVFKTDPMVRKEFLSLTRHRK